MTKHTHAMATHTPWPPIHSHLPGLLWPALPGQQGTLLATLLAQLEQSQWQTADAIRAAQSRQFGALISHARAHSRFHAERLADIECVANADWATRLTDVPIMHRTDLQSSRAIIDCAWYPPEHGRATLAQSTGSTGEPVGVRRTELNGLIWMAMTLREHLWQSRDFTVPLAVIRAQIAEEDHDRQGISVPNWGPPVNHLFASGPAHLLNLQTDIVRQADWLNTIHPGYLLTYPNNLSALLDLAECSPQLQETLRHLRQIRTVGETLHPVVRNRCRDIFGVSIADIYSSQEIGVIAVECPAGDGYHVMAEGLILEVLREDGTQCAAGEVGQVTVTDLHNFATPLIRYALGDLAEAETAPCPCGRGLPRIQRILGRERNLLHLPDGRRLWPLVGAFSYRDIAPIRQYQVIQQNLGLVILRLAADRPLRGHEESQLATRLRDALGFDFAVDFEYFPDRIPSGPGGKFEDFISRVGHTTC
jgi:phenylacetate-CoA ligase